MAIKRFGFDILDLTVIDEEGYRQNVGMIIINKENKVFWGRRIGQKSWQFPQGGIDDSETLEEAMFRELWEETGLNAEHVEILSVTEDWLSYDLPQRYRRKSALPICIGQKQRWFLLRLTADDTAIDLHRGEKAEFDAFRWVDYWYPIRKVIYFKRQVYRDALNALCGDAGIKPQRSSVAHTYQKKRKGAGKKPRKRHH